MAEIYERTADVNTMDVKSLGEFIQTKRKEMIAMDEGGALSTADANTLKSFQLRNAELTDAVARHSQLREASEAAEKVRQEYTKSQQPNRQVPFQTAGSLPGARGTQTADPEDTFKSLGDLFCESEAYQAASQKGLGLWNASSDGNIKSEIEQFSTKSLAIASLKATMATTAGWAPYPALSPRPPVMTALQMPTIADLVPTDDTTQPAILYYEETAFSDNADFVAEAGLKPEATLALTLRTQPVVKIAVTLPITDEQLMDVPQVRGYIDQRLTLMIRRKEDAGLLNGTGVAPQLQGFHTKVGIGSIQRQAGEDNADSILRAITDVNSIYGFANASGIVMNPLQWLAIRLLRTTTGDYIWGHPATIGPQTLWGLPVVSTAAQTPGRALVGDFQMYSHISRRLGIRIDVGFINDDFQKDIQRIRLEERLSLEIYRARAFEEVTNLN